MPGDWLLLKNLHLVVSWLPALEKEVHKLGPGRHSGFQLFLASQLHAKFPQTLLERSIKVGASCQRLPLLWVQPSRQQLKVLYQLPHGVLCCAACRLCLRPGRG